MKGQAQGRKTSTYSPITESLYLKLKDPLGPYVNLSNSPASSEKKKKLHKRISFSSFSNTTCSDIQKLNNYLPIENNIVLLSLGNYSFKVGLINKYDYKLESLRVPQVEVIEPWKELGYSHPPYKNYDIIEECLFHCFSNFYKINLKDKDLFIPFSSINDTNDFSTLGDILFDTFQVQSVTFREPSFLSSLIILQNMAKERQEMQQGRDVLLYKDDQKDSSTNCDYGADESVGTGGEKDKGVLHVPRGKIVGGEPYPQECLSNLHDLNLYNFTAILVNVGSTKTTCTPVINGIPLPDLTSTYHIGGYDIDNQIFDEMKKNKNYQKDISMEAAKIAKEKRVFTPKSKEDCGYLSLLYNQTPKNYLVSPFQLHFNKISSSAVTSTEIFFSPCRLGNYLKTESYKQLHMYHVDRGFLLSGSPSWIPNSTIRESSPSWKGSLSSTLTENTLPCVIYDTIQRCPIDTRKELFENIYLTGGSSIIRGFRERLQNELYDFVKRKNFYSNVCINVHSVRRRMLQKYAIYSGAHLFLEMFDYQNYQITRADYLECGDSILERLSLQGKLLF
ncbi:actin-like protein, putative [Plasmodium knowlesi strain H]|uniref:Actin-like protein, putative n=3 Tax=Plasmodium knowlesi TaxID=5850 RepID=A0A5K1V826_PLAKH|nr:actin-like protein, putative [Plasmodium knowlesi strain H]OTN67446.1 putative Actin-like protein [Plasmodium knowlesi]CAA9987377.1 actin-like protein, putative [Plasmodium knowlesi strain H]SBO23330.1 actin-like protein, putative [Plasmodium knowlesi strain H]SBO24430.1 actin-like protein, putative [Plasmodium knowlesi strain H]VVS76851.1 actin-like protein, putative [Plasmodium knowlesi strain H]|eukprot:XP_002258380.1 actin-like protein, putative [Plasmodium knowlesi strain H]